MRLEEMMAEFVESYEKIEAALDEARAEVNEVPLPPGLSQLRLSFAEISNLVESAVGMSPGNEGCAEHDADIIREGLEELSEQLFLHQFPQTMREAMASFKEDIVVLVREDNRLLGAASGILRQLAVRTSTRLSTSKKFERLTTTIDELLAGLPEDAPNHLLRKLDEIADFAQSMIVPVEKRSEPLPLAVNDNVPSLPSPP